MKAKTVSGRVPSAGAVRFVMNMTKELHKAMRIAAAKRGVTMSAMVLDALRAKGIK